MTEILLEELADFMHTAWQHWMKYLFSKVARSSFSPKDAEQYSKYVSWFKEDFERWEHQIETPYKDLSEKEKDSDREWAKLALDLVMTKDGRKSLKAINKIRKHLNKLESELYKI